MVGGEGYFSQKPILMKIVCICVASASKCGTGPGMPDQKKYAHLDPTTEYTKIIGMSGL